MKKASITDAKNNFSALIDGVKAGSPVLIVDRGRPVARLEPITEVAGDASGQLSRLVRGGIVRQARRPMAMSLFATKPPRAKGAVSVVAALVEDRRTGR